MAAKIILGVLVGVVVLWVYWSWGLAGLRGGREQIDTLNKLEDDIENAEQTLANPPLDLTEDESERIIEQYEDILIWVGDPLAPSRDQDYRYICPHIRQRLRLFINERPLINFSCTVGQPQPLALDMELDVAPANIVPLSLSMSSAERGDGELLVLSVHRDPALLLKEIVVSKEDDPDLGEDSDFSGIDYLETVSLTVDFYVRAEPLFQEIEAAQIQASAVAEKLFDGTMTECLLALPPVTQAGDSEDTIFNQGVDEAQFNEC